MVVKEAYQKKAFNEPDLDKKVFYQRHIKEIESARITFLKLGYEWDDYCNSGQVNAGDILIKDIEITTFKDAIITHK